MLKKVWTEEEIEIALARDLSTEERLTVVGHVTFTTDGGDPGHPGDTGPRVTATANVEPRKPVPRAAKTTTAGG